MIGTFSGAALYGQFWLMQQDVSKEPVGKSSTDCHKFWIVIDTTGSCGKLELFGRCTNCAGTATGTSSWTSGYSIVVSLQQEVEVSSLSTSEIVFGPPVVGACPRGLVNGICLRLRFGCTRSVHRAAMRAWMRSLCWYKATSSTGSISAVIEKRRLSVVPVFTNHAMRVNTGRKYFTICITSTDSKCKRQATPC